MEHPLKTLPSPLQADFNASPLLTTYVTSDSLIQALIQASSISTAVCHSSLPEGLPGSPCCWQLTFPGIQDTGISQGTADSRGWTLEDTTAPENEPTNRLSELPTRMCPFAVTQSSSHAKSPLSLHPIHATAAAGGLQRAKRAGQDCFGWEPERDSPVLCPHSIPWTRCRERGSLPVTQGQDCTGGTSRTGLDCSSRSLTVSTCWLAGQVTA